MAETDRTVVKTYVPRYQKEIWAQEAEQRGMSQSEFLRAMVQAGRSGFEGGSSGVDPGSDGLETVVQSALEDGPRSFDSLLEDVADSLQETLTRMQTEGTLQYVPGEGYALE
jgi:hypothetical protein